MVLYRNVSFFVPKIKHPDCFFPWALPTPGLWNKVGGCGNTIDADGIRLGTAALLHCALPQAFLFTVLQILCQPLSVEDCELAYHLDPASVSLGPFLCVTVKNKPPAMPVSPQML